MDKFLERYNLLTLNQEEIENMNRPNTSTDFTGEFYQTFKELMPTLLKLIQKISEEGTLPSSFYKATITLIQKSNKYITKQKITGQYHR